MLVIDRFEGDFAIVENDNGERFQIEKKLLSENAQEGSCVVEINGCFEVDCEATQKRRDEIIVITKKIGRL